MRKQKRYLVCTLMLTILPGLAPPAAAQDRASLQVRQAVQELHERDKFKRFSEGSAQLVAGAVLSGWNSYQIFADDSNIGFFNLVELSVGIPLLAGGVYRLLTDNVDTEQGEALLASPASLQQHGLFYLRQRARRAEKGAAQGAWIMGLSAVGLGLVSLPFFLSDRLHEDAWIIGAGFVTVSAILGTLAVIGALSEPYEVKLYRRVTEAQPDEDYSLSWTLAPSVLRSSADGGSAYGATFGLSW